MLYEMKESKPTVVALIPARAGSERIPHKNIRFLGKHPLMAYTIASARESGIFDAIILVTSSKYYAEIGRLSTNLTLVGAGTILIGIVLLLAAILLYSLVSVVREGKN